VGNFCVILSAMGKVYKIKKSWSDLKFILFLATVVAVFFVFVTVLFDARG